MRSPILNFFKLVLRVVFKLAPDVYHKGLGIVQVLSKIRLKFLLGYRNVRAFVKSITTIILSPAKANALAEEKDSK